jgi:hypothetical protein
MKTYLRVSVLATTLMLSCSEQAVVDSKEEEPAKLGINENRCTLVPDPGPCKAFFTKYYYDQSEKKCKEFSWGGCDGVVPFDTLEECEKCKDKL